MKIYLILILVLIYSCKTNRHKSDTENTIEKIQLKNQSPDQSLEIEDMVYQHMFLAKLEGTTDDYYQKLGINWVSDTEIEYALRYDNQLCEGFCEGKAQRKDSKVFTETIQFEDTYEFSFLKFEDEKENFNVLIKIEAQDKKTCQVVFQFRNDTGDCTPYETVMIAIK